MAAYRPWTAGAGPWTFTVTSILISLAGAAIIIVNRTHLYNTYTQCVPRRFPRCITYVTACSFSDDINDMEPCRYTYSVGAVAVVVQFTASLLLFCLSRVAIAMYAVCGAGSFGWWLAAAIYWTHQDREASNAGVGEATWREFCVAVGWTAMALCILQFLAAPLTYFMQKKYPPPPPQPAAVITMTSLPPPPPQPYPYPYPYQYPAYGAAPPPPAQGYAPGEPAYGVPATGYPYPPPPAAGYGAPPPPAGYPPPPPHPPPPPPQTHS